MTPPTPIPRKHQGRTFRWRIGMGLLGLTLLAGGGAIVLWPESLAFIAGGALGTLGVLLVVSAVAARGR